MAEYLGYICDSYSPQAMKLTPEEQEKTTSSAMSLMASLIKPGGAEIFVESLKDRSQIKLMRVGLISCSILLFVVYSNFWTLDLPVLLSEQSIVITELLSITVNDIRRIWCLQDNLGSWTYYYILGTGTWQTYYLEQP